VLWLPTQPTCESSYAANYSNFSEEGGAVEKATENWMEKAKRVLDQRKRASQAVGVNTGGKLLARTVVPIKNINQPSWKEHI
jgi:hypothetical protein